MVTATENIVIPGVIVLSTAAAVAAAVQLYRCSIPSVSERSTTSSAGGGAVAYETAKAVDEYVQMHYASADEVFPYRNAPKVRPVGRIKQASCASVTQRTAAHHDSFRTTCRDMLDMLLVE
jgi:hypothetical protein